MADDIYNVETNLVLRDDLIVGLRRAADVAGELDEVLLNIEKRLGTLGRSGLAGMTAGLDEMKAAATSLSESLATLKAPSVADIGLAALNRSLGIAEGRAARLKESLATLSIPEGVASRIPMPAGAGRGGGGGGRHGGGAGFAAGAQHGGSGRYHPTIGMNIPTGIGAAIGYGVYEEAQVQDLVNRVMLAANEGILGPDLMQNPQATHVRDIVRGAMSQTGMTANQAGEALMPVVLQMAGLPLDKRLDLAPMFEKFAFIESKLKGVDPAEASGALVGMLHMTGSYSPEAMQKMASQLAFVSTVSPLGLPGIERTASYVMPSAMTAGIDAGPLLAVLANAQAAGVISTKSGTWFDALFRSLSPKGGLASLISTKAGEKRLAAMKQLGLVDLHNRNVGLDMLEKGQWTEFSQMLATNLAKIPEDKRLGVEFEATGSTQAGRALGMLSQPSFTQNLPQLQQQQTDFLSGGLDAVIKKLAEGDPTVQFRQTLADFTSALMDLGKVVLPPLTAALHGIDDTLKHLVPSLPGADNKPWTATDVGVAGGLGVLGLGFGSRLLTSAYTGLKGLLWDMPVALKQAVFPSGAAGAGGAAGGAAEAVAGGAGLGLSASLGIAAGLTALGAAGGWVAHHLGPEAAGTVTGGTYDNAGMTPPGMPSVDETRRALGGVPIMPGGEHDWRLDHAHSGSGAGLDRVTQAVQQSGAKVDATTAAVHAVEAAIHASAAQIAAAVAGAIGGALSGSIGRIVGSLTKPPGGTSSIDSRLAPLYPSTAF